MKYKSVRLEFHVGDEVQNVTVWTHTENRRKPMDTIADSLNTIWKTWKGEAEKMIARK